MPTRRSVLFYLKALAALSALPATPGCVTPQAPQKGTTPAGGAGPAQGEKAQLPDQVGLILSGPILRRVEPSTCAVFLALSAPCSVTLRIFEVGATEPLFSAIRQTVPLGTGLHVVVVQADRAASFRPNQPELTPGRTYEYDLLFSTQDDPAVERHLYDQGILTAPGSKAPKEALARLCYPGHSRPSFVVPAAEKQGLRLLQGSCRKPHGNGADELARVDRLIEASAGRGETRPQMLFLTGDQIYADDVHPTLLSAARAVGHRYIGTKEEEDPGLADLLNAPSRQQGLLAAGLSSTEAANHLVSFGEFVGMYLLVWSDALWSTGLAQVAELSQFASTLPKVRRALANVATYMIFDDHEITDDWYIRKEWCDKVLSEPLGRRVLRNGLAAYAVFQHYGNHPADFDGRGVGADLMMYLRGWTGSTGMGRDVNLDKLLGIPKRGADLVANGNGAIRWSYTLSGPDYEVVVLDTRTRRAFSGNSVALVSQAEIDARLPLREASKGPRLTILVSAAPVVNLRVVEQIQEVASIMGRTYEIDDEAWAHSPTYDYLLERILSRKRAVVLSGDVHYGLCASSKRQKDGAVFVSLVSSSLKNSSLKGRPPPLPERVPPLPPIDHKICGTRIFERSLIFQSHLGDVRFDGKKVLYIAWHQASGAEGSKDLQRMQELSLTG